MLPKIPNFYLKIHRFDKEIYKKVIEITCKQVKVAKQ